MKNEEAYAALIKKDPQWLSRPIEELVTLQAVGVVYLATHQKLLKQIKTGQIHLAEEDRKSKLADGQAIGEALLDIEVKIGQMLPSAAETKTREAKSRVSQGINLLPEGYQQNNRKKAQYARALAANPAAVAAIKAEARENEDIPTKTAALNRIKYEKEKERHEKAVKEGRATKTNIEMTLEQQSYLAALQQIVILLPKQPPKNWTQHAFNTARGYVDVIIARLEKFNETNKALLKEK